MRHEARPVLLVACLLSVILSVTPKAFAQEPGKSSDEVLTNETVIKMVKANLSPIIIVSKIRTSKVNFNLSTDELIRLQQEKVPDEVIKAMVDSASSEASRVSETGAGDVTKTDPNDPLSTHEAGIYYFQEANGVKKLVQIEPSVYSQTKSGGMFAQALTYGIAKVKSKAVLSTPHAKLQLDTPRPVFYFYFEVKNSGLSNSGNVYSSSTSPNEFVMVKMDEKTKTRELVVGQYNLFGAQSGTLDKYARPFDYEKVAPGVYKVTPKEDLIKGEYGLFYGGSSPIATYGYFGAPGGSKVFDFGITLSIAPKQ
jgi:hypothetical protein